MKSLWKAIGAGLLTAGLLAAGLVTGPAPSAQAADSPAPTPPLGWNSWNTFYCNIDEAKIRSAADALVSSGMKDAGYEYVVVDDCWQSPTRDADGNLQADPTRFPSGMKALGDYIHSQGLKFGIYQAPREKTCAQYFGATTGATGAQGHEVQDANLFASWGVDYLKYDWCSDEGTLQEQIDAFTLMRDALRATDRPIVYSINPNSIRPNRGAEYYWGDIADLWRTTEDITAAWSSGCTADCFMGVTEILDVQAGLTEWNGPGHWNDPDMLEVGKGNILTPTENRAHFGMWALMASPLIAGNDITTMTDDTRSILTNTDIIAVNQDPNGIQATRIRDDGDVEVWAKPLSDGSVAVGLLNRGGGNVTISTTATEIGLAAAANYTATDLYTKAVSNTSGTVSASVPRHGLAIFRVAAGAAENTGFTLQGVQSGRCVDVAGGVVFDAVRAVIADCDPGSLTQQLAEHDGQFILGGKCLDVDRNLTTAGTAAIFWECNGQTNQKWQTQPDGSLRSLSADKCLDVDNNGTASGTALLIWDCNGQQNQQWVKVIEPAPAQQPEVSRIAGADRFEVSVNTSKAGWSEGSDTVYVASGEVFPDALSAASAAAVADAPILLTTSGSLSSSVKAEIQRLGATEIVIVGGPKTISAAVETELKKLGTVTRIGGADRFEASRNIAKHAFPDGAEVAVLATGLNFPDALSAGAAVAGRGPVILVNGGASGLDAATKSLLTDLGVDEIAVAGGTASVSAGIQTDAAAIAETVRLGGADRFAASRAINAHFVTEAQNVLLATGSNFPDALSGSAFGPRIDAPLFTVQGSCIPAETLAQITALGAEQITLLGGTATLSPAVEQLQPCAG
ncbi:cell wall-binding repeat-containing protein [Herbiconiux sp. P18]|uniref:cell wall-binding repeat-containing protein n=1 Tax=Herbiconiux liangxiaofengii TaxID=3342795 RepID=UPI0035B97C48